MTRTKKAILAFRHVARPVFAGIYPRNSCITQTRIVVDIFERLGIEARPLTTSLILKSEKHQTQYVAGFTDEERASMKTRAAKWIDRHKPAELGWKGHLVTLVNNHIVDTSLDQASNQHFTIEPDILICKVGIATLEGKELNMKVECRTGEEFTLTYVVRKQSGWEDSDAWKMLPPMRTISKFVALQIERHIR